MLPSKSCREGSKLWSLKQVTLLVLFFVLRIQLGGGGGDEDEDLGWINLSNSPFVDTSFSLDHPANAHSCINRGIVNDNRADFNVKASGGLLYNIDKDSTYDKWELDRESHWLEAKELGAPIMDTLPLEGRAFCLSGKHYRNSPELLNHVNFIHMKELAEHDFNIGSHVYHRDYAQMNFFRPMGTNLGKTSFARLILKGWQNTIPSLGRPYMPDPKAGYPYLFWIKWKEADATFFHIKRTWVQYLGNKDSNNPGDPDPNARKLDDYMGSAIRPGDKNLLYLYRPSHPDGQPDPRCKNPYFVDITEIEVDGVKLHNWLHITVYVRPINIVKTLKNCAKGKMRWILLEVRDSMGLPIGDFNSDFPCGASCRCKSEYCKMVKGEKHNAMPCMFTPTRALTQPGLFMYGVPEDGERFNEVHATWHFAQHSSYFATELHFSALIVEDGEQYQYYNGRRTMYRNPRTCVGVTQPFTWFCGNKLDDECIKFRAAGQPHSGTRPSGGDACRALTGTTPKVDAFIFTWAWQHQFRLPSIPNYPPGSAYPEAGVCDEQFDMPHHRWFYEDENPYLAKNDPLRPPEYYQWSLQHLSAQKRYYGWNAQYTMLKPTLETLGGWDHYQPNKLTDPTLINCHKLLDEEYYEKNQKQILKGRLPLKRNFYKYRQDYRVQDKVFMHLSYQFKMNLSRIYKPINASDLASSDSSDYETMYSRLPLSISVTNPSNKHGPPYELNRVYFGTLGTKLAYEDELGIDKTKLLAEQKGYDEQFATSEIGKYFLGLPTVQQISMDERCACPAFGTTQDPEQQTKQIETLQGRSAHATQMLLAWVVVIPIGLFVSRYYKETYNRVFILEEFWWYTTHLMCMGTAFIFMIGGIYSIEVKHVTRDKFDAMSSESQAHILLGSITICIFGLQLVLSPFRMWIITERIVNIVLHFVFGISCYLFGITAVLLSVAIPQSRMSCSAFYIYIGFLVCQVLIYLFMELHMRYVDRILMLYPVRSYLPPPVIRVFHTNAPLSQFRLYILAFYVLLCWSVFFILRYGVIELSVNIASCYKNLGNDYEDDA